MNDNIVNTDQSFHDNLYSDPLPFSQSSLTYHNRFSPHHISPYLSNTKNLISFASLNIKGITNQTKFDNLLQDFTEYNLSLISLQETHLTEVQGKMYTKSFYFFLPQFTHAKYT